jgi:hypothetical protein
MQGCRDANVEAADIDGCRIRSVARRQIRERANPDNT